MHHHHLNLDFVHDLSPRNINKVNCCKKKLATLLICLFLENVVNSVNQVSYHWKVHVFTFLKRYHFKVWHFSVISQFKMKGFYEWDIVGKVNMGLPQRWNPIHRSHYVFQKYTILAQFPNSFEKFIYSRYYCWEFTNCCKEYKIVLPQYV